MEAYINDILPFNGTNTREVIHEINMIVRSNAIGIPLLAIIQGGIAMIGYLIFGAPSVLLLGFLTCFATIIPMVGTALVWFPVAAYLAISGDWFHAIGLFAYGAIVVSQSDNLIRFIPVSYTHLPAGRRMCNESKANSKKSWLLHGSSRK